MFNRRFFSVAPAACALGALLALVPQQAHAAPLEPSQYLFVGDLKTGSLFRYGVEVSGSVLSLTPYGLNGSANPGYIVNQGVTEGVHGTGDTLITSQQLQGGTWRISRFNRFTGDFINYVTQETFGGIGNLALTNDAKFVYVPDEARSKLVRVNVATGAIEASVDMPGVHDVQIGADDFIYATGYSRNTGVRRYTADLSSYVEVVAPDADGLNRPAGLVVSGNTLYVAQNSQQINAKVYQYTLNGDNPAAYVTQVTDARLSFSFGMEMGPDGNLYIAVPGSFTGQGGPNQIVKLDISSGFGQGITTASSAIVYSGTNTHGNNGTNTGLYSDATTDLIWPKYIKFSSNFAPANDPGNPLGAAATAPEPGTIALLLTAGVPLAGLVRRRKK